MPMGLTQKSWGCVCLPLRSGHGSRRVPAGKKPVPGGNGPARGARGLFFQIRQAFPPGEVTAEEANKLGYETAMRWTKGKYQFFVCTIQTGDTSTITFITTPQPLTAPESSIISSAPALPCGGCLTGCVLSMSCPIFKIPNSTARALSPLRSMDRGKAAVRETAGEAGCRCGIGEKAL